MKNIGIITCAKYPSLSPDDKILLETLDQYKDKIKYSILVWDCPDFFTTIENENFDYLVIRSLWDYFYPEKFNTFNQWLDKMSQHKIKMFNTPSLIKWNLDKNYLNELYTKYDVPIVPSIFVTNSDITQDGAGGNDSNGRELETLVRNALKDGSFDNDSTKFVFKPTVGADAYGTYQFQLDTINNELNDTFKSLLERSDIIIQPFMNSVQEEGELSFIFFNGKFSHASIKNTKKGDFRVQEAYGGVINRLSSPSKQDIEQAQSILDKVLLKFNNIIYARVDMLRYKGSLHLGELEVFEPSLYFLNEKQTAVNYIEELLNI